jgi:hypothetical protein
VRSIIFTLVPITRASSKMLMPGEPCGVALSPTHLYWADYDTGEIDSAKLDGTHVRPGLITTSSTFLCGVAVDNLP